MTKNRALLFAMTSLVSLQAGATHAQTATPAASADTGEIIVTAQKRQQNIQDVGLSVVSASGADLVKAGVTDTASLQKLVPGFVATPNYGGVTLFTIRGVGFQDVSLAGSPTVSIYLDEAPLPYSILAQGASLDLERVEVVKGPQGTLFGNNATGGAINYIAGKPTSHLTAGADFTYGRFSDVNAQGFVSGPLSDTLNARLALQSHTSGAWQKGYGPQAGQSIGGQDLLNGRLSFVWKPDDRLTARLTLNGWRDKGYNQVGQLFATGARNTGATLSPGIADYPLAPHNDRAAGWNSCVNTSPFAPVAGQALGTTFPTPSGVAESQGTGSAAQAGAQPTTCSPLRRDNTYYDGTLRLDYDVADDVTVTSITQYQHFKRYAGVDESGVPYLDAQFLQSGHIRSFFQELRVAGKWGGKGSWLIGANYQHDNTLDSSFLTATASPNSPTVLPNAVLCLAGVPGCTPAENPASPTYDAARYPLFNSLGLGPIDLRTAQQKSDYAVYASGEYPLTDTVTVLGGIRYTQENLKAQLCTYDAGDGSWAQVTQNISDLVEVLSGTITINQYLNGQGHGVYAGLGGCGTTGLGPDFLSLGNVPFRSKLDQHNVSWRTGVNWKPVPEALLYANVSKGYKGGSFPTVVMSTYKQGAPVTQESLLSYEVGFKSSWFDRQLTLNGAAYYYDYKNKQILGSVVDPVFGALAALVNVPKSHVEGFELSGVLRPRALHGFTLTPSISYQKSRIEGCSSSGNANCINGRFNTFDNYGVYTDITGQSFPYAPKWQGAVDAEYQWPVSDHVSAFVGANLTYTSHTNSNFLNTTNPSAIYNPLDIRSYALLDLRAGIQTDSMLLQVWGRNVTNKWYWTSAYQLSDTAVRYTGMPVTYGITLSYRYR